MEEQERSQPDLPRRVHEDAGDAGSAEASLAGLAMSEAQWADARVLLDGSGKEFLEMALHSMQELALAGQATDASDPGSSPQRPGLSMPPLAAAHAVQESGRLSRKQDAPQPDASVPELDIGALPVTLTVELGRLRLDFQTVSGLFAGQVLELLADAASASLMANGCRIGQGRLVQCQSGLALQITHLDASPS